MGGVKLGMKTVMKEYVQTLLYPPDTCKFCGKPVIRIMNKEQKDIFRGLNKKQILKVKNGIERLKYICNTCKEQLVVPMDPSCHYCHKPLYDNKNTVCLDCSNNPDPIINRSVVVYNDFIRKEIALYKYRGKESLSEILGMLLTITYQGYYCEEKIDYLTFVPLHQTRLEERGFNQAEQLATFLHRFTGIPVLDTLIRVKETDKQSKINKGDRVIQLKGSFMVKENIIKYINNKNMLVIDDIYTTGSTLSEVAKELKDNGAKAVQGLTLARAYRYG